MIIPNIWENKTCSKPPTSNSVIGESIDFIVIEMSETFFSSAGRSSTVLSTGSSHHSVNKLRQSEAMPIVGSYVSIGHPFSQLLAVCNSPKTSGSTSYGLLFVSPPGNLVSREVCAKLACWTVSLPVHICEQSIKYKLEVRRPS